MDVSEEIEIPEIIPVMTLSETVLFPHAVMPLFIFEPRYREMLADVLKSHRLFAVFNERCLEAAEGHEEPLAAMGTVGVVRAAHQNPDGTTNLALQGIIRVRLLEIVREEPYRLIRVESCPNPEEPGAEGRAHLRDHIISLIDDQPELARGLPEEYVEFLKSLRQPASFIDVAIHSLCQDAAIKQRLLETLSLNERFTAFEQFLLREQRRLNLFGELQGQTRDEEIPLN
jgi:Lon protease-like protein